MIATAAQAGTYTRICACGNEFKVTGAQQKRYCSVRCRTRRRDELRTKRAHRGHDTALEASCEYGVAQGCGIIMAAVASRRMDAHERAHRAVFASGRN